MLISRILRLGALSFLIVALWLLWQGIGLIVGLFRAPSTPPVENQPAVSAPLSGSLQQLDMPALQGHAVVTVDPGHGGFDPGLGDASALEKDIAFSISTKLKQHLENAGVTVVLTRTGDEDLSLDQRAALANEVSSQLFVSIHCNSNADQAQGMDCYYHQSESAEKLARSILDAAKVLKVTTRQVQKNNNQVLWETNMPAVLVEAGFLSDTRDRANLVSPIYQDNVARAIAYAVVTHLNTQPI